MSEMTPAETLRAAAAKLREHAGLLELVDVRGPWKVHAGPSGYPQSVGNVGVPTLICNTFDGPQAPPASANWIALMHPGVGVALAAWLVDVAEEAERHGQHPFNLQEEVTHPHPIAVARAVLGGGEAA